MSREKLEDAKRNWEEKLAHYQCELAITADASRKFELRKGIQESNYHKYNKFILSLD